MNVMMLMIKIMNFLNFSIKAEKEMNLTLQKKKNKILDLLDRITINLLLRQYEDKQININLYKKIKNNKIK